jgi:hypothetical protein
VSENADQFWKMLPSVLRPFKGPRLFANANDQKQQEDPLEREFVPAGLRAASTA